MNELQFNEKQLTMDLSSNRRKIETMRERVLEFCKQKEFVSSIDLEEFKDKIRRDEGIVRGLLRVSREARQLAQDGILRRLGEGEKTERGFNRKFAVYQWGER